MSSIVKPSRIKFPLLSLVAGIVLSSCTAKDPMEIESRIETVHKSLKMHTIDSLRPYLAPGYTVKGLPQGLEPFVLPSVFEKFPSPDRYEITKTETEKRGTRLYVTFYSAKSKPVNTNFLIASDGKFLELNLLEDADVNISNDSISK